MFNRYSQGLGEDPSFQCTRHGVTILGNLDMSVNKDLFLNSL
jgi:hypothetical protein